MRRALALFLLVFCSYLSIGQSSFFEQADSVHKGRLIGVSASIATVWSGSMIGLSQVWYKDVEKTSWHTFDDSRNWLQMDKVGHVYTAYKLNQLNTDFYMWSGLSSQKAVWFGTGISIGYQTTLELFDSFSTKWGWSWADVASNTIGTFMYTGQRLIWDEERIIPKFSYHPTDFAAIRPNVFGSSFPESLLKDYNGQTYWLSFSPGSFTKGDQFPEWLCFSIGYSAHDKLVGSEEYYLDETTGLDYHSKRELIFSMDIDFSKLPVKKPWAKMLVKQLNYLKVPFPALIIRGGQLKGSGLYF